MAAPVTEESKIEFETEEVEALAAAAVEATPVMEEKSEVFYMV